MVRYSVESVLCTAIESWVTIISMVAAGYLNSSAELAGLGLAYSCVWILMFTIANGFSGALDSFVCHIYGRKDYYLTGEYFNAGLFLLTVVYGFEIIFYVNSEWVFLALGQPAESSKIAALYLSKNCESICKFLSCFTIDSRS